MPIASLACTHANTIIYLRKRSTDGTSFVADGTAEHIKITAHGVAAMTQVVSGDAQRFTEHALQISAFEDGSANNPIIITTASAIT